MRRVALVVAIATLLIGGCASASAPPSTDPAGAPVSSAAAPTAVPGAVTAPPVGTGPADVTALNIDFEPKTLTAPAGTVVINLHNRDNGIPHNLEIKDSSGTAVYQGPINIGPFDSQETVGDLEPGAYTFTCTVHPTMQGTLTVLP